MRAYLHALSFFHEHTGTVFDSLHSSPGTNFKIPTPENMNALDLRRLTSTNRLALYLAMDAVKKTEFDPAVLGSVFASAHGDAEVFDEICKTLASNTPELSPMKFSHSLLNTAAGIWGITAKAECRSISLSAADYTVGMGLLEALLMVPENPCVLVCYNTKTPEPLCENYCVDADCGFAMVLAHQASPTAWAEINFHLVSRDTSPPSEQHTILFLQHISSFLQGYQNKTNQIFYIDVSPTQRVEMNVKWLT